jgi:hypothetical protein
MRREPRRTPRRPKQGDGAKLIVIPDLAKVRADLEDAEKVADTTLKAYGALLRRRWLGTHGITPS